MNNTLNFIDTQGNKIPPELHAQVMAEMYKIDPALKSREEKTAHFGVDVKHDKIKRKVRTK